MKVYRLAQNETT